MFVDIDESIMALEYRKTDILLSTGYPEGFGLPSIKGMFCDCVVVGFSGRGGREVMQNGETAMGTQDGDCITVAKYQIDILTNNDLKEKLRHNMSHQLQFYTQEKMRERLIDVYKQVTIKKSL
jgi:glycosyltransferase involved in cell wall biosynthesis